MGLAVKSTILPKIAASLLFTLPHEGQKPGKLVFCNSVGTAQPVYRILFKPLRTFQVIPEFVAHIMEISNGFSMIDSFHGFRTEEGDAHC